MMLMMIMILSILWIMMYITSMKNKNNIKTMTPFECGYNVFLIKMPLSIQFTLIVVIFLLFDIELSILITSNWKIQIINKHWIMMMITFLMMMIMSVIYEMTKKSLKWS